MMISKQCGSLIQKGGLLSSFRYYQTNVGHVSLSRVKRNILLCQYRHRTVNRGPSDTDGGSKDSESSRKLNRTNHSHEPSNTGEPNTDRRISDPEGSIHVKYSQSSKHSAIEEVSNPGTRGSVTESTRQLDPSQEASRQSFLRQSVNADDHMLEAERSRQTASLLQPSEHTHIREASKMGREMSEAKISRPVDSPSISEQPITRHSSTLDKGMSEAQVNLHKENSHLSKPTSATAVPNTDGRISEREPRKIPLDLSKLKLEFKQPYTVSGGTIYKMSQSEVLMMRAIRGMLFTGLTGCMAFIEQMCPTWCLQNVYECLGILAISTALPYLIHQHNLWCRIRPISIVYDTNEMMYHLTYLKLVKLNTIAFTPLQLQAPPDHTEYIEGEKGNETKKQGLLDRIKSLYRAPADPFMFIVYPGTSKSKRFKLNRNLMDMSNEASEIFFKREKAVIVEEYSNKTVTLDPDGRTLGKLTADEAKPAQKISNHHPFKQH